MECEVQEIKTKQLLVQKELKQAKMDAIEAELAAV